MRIRRDVRQVSGEVAPELDALEPAVRREQFDRAFDDAVDRDAVDAGLARAGVVQEPAYDPVDPVRLALRGREERALLRADGPRDDRQVAEDRAERVADLVRDPGREPAD